MNKPLLSSAASIPMFTEHPLNVNWQAISQLLIAALRPSRIYRIEHTLSGDKGTKKYNNLIILMAVGDTTPLREYEPILQLMNAGTESVQCSFHRPRTVKGWIQQGHPFFCRALVPQNLIYDNGTLLLPEPEPTAMAMMNQQLAEQFRMFFGKLKHSIDVG